MFSICTKSRIRSQRKWFVLNSRVGTHSRTQNVFSRGRHKNWYQNYTIGTCDSSRGSPLKRKRRNQGSGHPFPLDFHEFHSHKTDVKHDMFIKQFRKTQLTNVHTSLDLQDRITIIPFYLFSCCCQFVSIRNHPLPPTTDLFNVRMVHGWSVQMMEL